MCRRRRVHCSCSATCTCARTATCQGGEVKSIKAALSNWQGTESPILEPGCGTVTTCPTHSAELGVAARGGRGGTRKITTMLNKNCWTVFQSWLVFATKASTHAAAYSQMRKQVNMQWHGTALVVNPTLQLKETWLNFFCLNLLHFLNHFLKETH